MTSKGVIKKWILDRGLGFITPDDGSEDVKFFADNLRGGSADQIREGARVEYELRARADKPTTQSFSIVVAAAAAGTKPPAAPHGIVQPDRAESAGQFLNPYNFVRYLADRPSRPDDPPAVQLLGRCPPPPHDRWVGLSGQIQCELTVETPLFISDSEEVQIVGEEHKSYRFFQYNGQPVIPASSLRGMVRSVFEAVTNSCLAVFDGERRLPYRNIRLAPRLQPGIVMRLPKGDQPGLIARCKEARVGAYPGGHRRVELDSSWKTGDTAYAVIKTTQSHDRYASPIAHKHVELGNVSDIVEGLVKITGEGNIDRKYCERFFYDIEGNQSRWMTFSTDRKTDYDDVMAQQLETKGFKTEHQHATLTPGDMVYVELEPDGRSAKNIAAVRVPRLLYRQPIGQLVPKEFSTLRRCEKPLDLCPACRTFGWVASRASKPVLGAEIAYAGRVRFSNAALTHDAGVELPIALAILSSPKPTTTGFYLADSAGRPADVTYDTAGARLRGRKFYRHQGTAHVQEYQRATDEEHDGKDDQNRTVSDARKPGNRFKFMIDFENLASVELGALLWALELEPGMCHRLGFAKPLGFGSVSLRVSNLQIVDPEKHYAALANGWSERNGRKATWIDGFKKALAETHGKDFNALDNVHDLRVLLSQPQSGLAIHYPRTPDAPDPEGKNFEWFMENKRGDGRSREGLNLSLPLAVDEEYVGGLPQHPSRPRPR